MEVHVDELREIAAWEPAREVAERVRRRDRGDRPTRRQLHHRRCVERSPPPALAQIRRSPCSRRAVDVAELGAGFGDVDIGVPAAAAEERRRQTELSHSCSLGEDALARASAGRSRMIGRRPVRVVPERPERSSLACPLEPQRLVLAERSVGRTHERGDRATTGPTPLQCDEARPHRVVERSLNVAGHDRVPFPCRGAHRRRS